MMSDDQAPVSIRATITVDLTLWPAAFADEPIATVVERMLSQGVCWGGIIDLDGSLLVDVVDWRFDEIDLMRKPEAE